MPQRIAPPEHQETPGHHEGPTRGVRTVNHPGFPELAFDRCALCASASDLRASHIIPGFVFDWLRDTSATGHFRFSENLNRRVQDGLKPKMLCSNCEQMFASWEKTFAEKCFVPINRGSAPSIRYGPWMLKYSTSVSWRVVRLFKAAGLLSEVPGDVQVQVDLALRAWKLFLFGERPHPGRHEQHMLLTDVIESSSIPDLPPNMNRYLTRAIEPYVAFSEHTVISYAKMGRFVLFGFVDVKHPRRWKGTKLHVRDGRFGQRDIELPSEAGHFIVERARVLAHKTSQLSERQLQRIRKSYESDLDRAAQSETFRAMHHDVRMFGDTAFAPARELPPNSENNDAE